MLKNIRSYFYNFKKYQAPLEKYIFPVILFLYPFIGVNQGLDITDTTYSLANFEFLDHMDPMWLFSTFLSNIFGSFIMHLPGAGTMLGFGIYSTFIICAIALMAYYSLLAYMPGWMIFIGVFISESLCWCPRVILYNYITYLFFTLGVIFLLKGIFAWERQGIFLFMAGVMLGLNVMARFPNLVEAAMILVLWFYCIITGSPFGEAVKKTFICIGGYLAGFGIPFIVTCIFYGKDAYVQSIIRLFAMTEGASDYSTDGMLSLIMEAYMSTASKMILVIPCVMAGIVMFMLREEKLVWAKKLVFVAGLLVLMRYYFSKGVITRNYQYYDSVFNIAMMFVIIALVLNIIGSTGFLNGSRQEQTLAFAALLIILITPIGSNNLTYPVLNNLFIVAPITLWMMRRLMQRLGERHLNFAWQSAITVVIVILLVQSVLFHIKFAFLDGDDGTVRDARASSIAKVQHMVTGENNAESLMELAEVLRDKNLLDKKVVLFNNVPGLSYIFDLEPAMNTVWPDLDSYSISEFENQIAKLQQSDAGHFVIMGTTMRDYHGAERKYDILMDYIANRGYNKVFESDRFIVYSND
jgi:hypothetical protein